MKELIFAIAVGVFAGSDVPEKRVWTADQIEWQRIDKDGTKYAVLDGNRDEAGKPFTYAFWMPGGVWVKPHTHTQQAHVVVVKGSIKLGYGAKLDKSKTMELKAGQFFIVRAGEAHFEVSDGECLIIGTALGGWKTKELE
ncbi:MAG: cupin domain-containing protein [Acidobacteria bacterium]|nr:cupin domain-containing protein [Acidobacteriota bacterium]